VSGDRHAEADEPVEAGRRDSDIRTFVIADVRGYTRYTQEHGDEEAGALAARFAELARETVASLGGEVIELRGDEALCVFASARQALRAAVSLQTRFRTGVNGNPVFPLGIGIGLDAGEAVPIEGGFRGGSLNLAARLCALAKPGEILASDTVVGLAGRLEGVRFVPRRPVRLKGIERPVRVMEVVSETALPPVPELVRARNPNGRWLVVGTVMLITLLGGLVALGINRATRPGSLSGLTPNSVGIIDAGSGRISSDIEVGTRPSAIASGAGSLWIADAADGTVSRVDPETLHVLTIPVGGGPTAVTVAYGSVWVANSLDRTVSRIPTDTNKLQVIPVGNGPRALTAGLGGIWVANGVDSTVSRIDPTNGKVSAPIPVGAAPTGLAVAEGSLWVTSEATSRVLRLDPSGRILNTVEVGNAPSAIASSADSLWVANAQDGTVSRVDPEAGSVVDTIPTGTNPRALAVNQGAVWVANADDGTLTEIDIATGDLDRRIELASSPIAIASAGGSIWATTVQTPASHRGGTLRVEFGSLWYCGETKTKCFDPNLVWDYNAWSVFTNVYDGLVAQRRVGGPEGGSIVPDLAQNVPDPTDGGRTYTFQLRSGIRFSNGEPVTASDVRASLERALKISFAASYYAGIVGGAECAEDHAHCDLSHGIEANDETGTVVIHLERPDPDFLFRLALPFASVVPAGSPQEIDDGSRLPGTGPYKLDEFTSREIRLVRNPSFRVWSRDAQPAGYPDEIAIQIGEDANRQIAAVTSGSADYVTNLPRERLSRLATRYPAEFHSDPAANVQYVFLRVTEPPFDDRRVRQALNYAVDRRAMVEAFGGPAAAQPTCQFLPPNLPGYRPYCPYTLDPNPAGTWTAPDVARANRLIEASGTKGMRVQMTADAPREAVGRYFVALLRQLGYRASLRVFDNPGQYSIDFIAGHEQRVQIGTTGWLADFLAPSNFLQVLFACPSRNGWAVNDQEFCNPRIDDLMRRAASEQLANPAAALALWAQVDRAITDEAPVVSLVNTRGLALVSKRVGNYQYHPQFGPLLDQLWVQ
jgi:YVTN family beta-propeller protein